MRHHQINVVQRDIERAICIECKLPIAEAIHYHETAGWKARKAGEFTRLRRTWTLQDQRRATHGRANDQLACVKTAHRIPPAKLLDSALVKLCINLTGWPLRSMPA